MAHLMDLAVSAYAGYAREREFNGTTNCVTGLYMVCLEPVRTGPVKKINVELWSEEAAKGYGADRLKTHIRGALDTMDLYRQFDFDEYWRLDEMGKKRAILDVTEKSCSELSRYWRWPTRPFETAASEALNRELRYEYFWKRPAWNTTKDQQAFVWIEHHIDRIDVTGVVKDRGGQEVRRRLLVSTRPHEIYLTSILGKLGWRDVNRAMLCAPDGKTHWDF